MNSVEQTDVFEVQRGNHSRFVEGLSFETKMQSLSMTYLLLFIPSASSKDRAVHLVISRNAVVFPDFTYMIIGLNRLR